MSLRSRLSTFLVVVSLAFAVSARAQSPNIVLRVCETRHGAALCGPGGTMNWAVRADQLSTSTGPFYYVFLFGMGIGEDPIFPGMDPRGISTISGVECGIDYDGAYAPEGGESPISVFAWTLLGNSQIRFGDWPAPGSGNIILWNEDNCQYYRENGITFAMTGYFYVGAYAPGQIRVTPNPASGLAVLANCFGNGATVDVTPPVYNCALGVVGFQQEGFNGVCAVPVVPATWSRVKSHFRD